MISLRSYIKQLKECFIRYPNTLKWVKKNLAAPCFLTDFSVIGYLDEILLLLFDISLKEENGVKS